jgi:ligand-binding sensor domain-containing protein
MKALFLLLAVVPGLVLAQGTPRVIETFQVGPTVYVRALAVEPARGALWVGTSAGLNEVDLESGKLRSTFTRRDGLASEQVFALAIDAQGYKWIGTGAGGASRYRDGSFKTYFPMHGLADYRVFSFAQDARGAMWMGTLAGASRLERSSGKFTTYAKQLVNEWVYGLAVDPKGQVWFATEGGVSMFDGKTWRAWTQADGLGAPRSEHGNSPRERGNYTLAVHAGKDGAIWAGTWGGGAARFDGARWTSLTSKDGLAGNIVYSIAQEADGTLWFGTDAGLSWYDGKKLRTLGPKEGLPGPNVFALAAAPKGEVWAGARGAVVRLARRQGEK